MTERASAPFFRGSRHLRTGQPQNHPAELHQQVIERPVDLDKIIHRTTPGKE
jgi:hypothetical protein